MKYKMIKKEEVVLVCEMYFGFGMSILEISKELNIVPSRVSRTLNIYFKKPQKTTVLQSKVNLSDENFNLLVNDKNNC
jgi:hypothetical protein